VVAAAHQAELDLVLHVFDVEGTAAGARAYQGTRDGLRQAIDHFAHAGRSRALRAVHREKGFHHRDGDFLRLEGYDGAVAANDLVVGEGAGARRCCSGGLPLWGAKAKGLR